LADSGPDANANSKKERSIAKGERTFNISFLCELAPVFPSGIVGLGERGSERFDAAKNTVRELDHGPLFNCTPTIAGARLGMGEHALKTLTLMVENWQLFPQGFFVDTPPNYTANLWEVNQAAIIQNGQRSAQFAELPNRWFDLPTFEPSGSLMTTLNEMLMQSHDGVIRLFPALPESWKDAAFRLAAVGAFVVTAERRGGETLPFTVGSARGGRCRMENPWPGAPLSVRDLSSGRIPPLHKEENGIIAFDTQQSSTYLVFRTGHPETLPAAPELRLAPNQAPKEWRGRRIGMMRHF
jgi:hypothetical protein